MEKSYKVICYSKWRFAVLLLISLFTMLPITVFFLRFGTAGQIVIIFFAVVLSIFPLFVLPKYVAKAILLISFDKEGFQLEWVKPYFGNKPKPIQCVRFDELKSYKYTPSYSFSTLKLVLKSDSKIQLHQWYNDSNDDFDKFMTHFNRTVEIYNKKKSTTIVIEKEKLIMENRTFLVMIGLLIGVVFIATILLIILKGVSNIKGIISILIVLGPLIWVVAQIVNELQKDKNNEQN